MITYFGWQEAHPVIAQIYPYWMDLSATSKLTQFIFDNYDCGNYFFEKRTVSPDGSCSFTGGLEFPYCFCFHKPSGNPVLVRFFARTTDDLVLLKLLLP